MKRLFILLVSATMLSGCISQRYARLTQRSDHTELLLGKTYICIIPWLGGPMIIDRFLQLPGQKADYRGEEVQVTSRGQLTTPYSGSVSIISDKQRVVVRLTNEGRPFQFNGRWRYQVPSRSALSRGEPR